MAKIVDRQNAGDKQYKPMFNDFESNAYQCALELVFNGIHADNGLTEDSLTKFRRLEKGKSTSRL